MKARKLTRMARRRLRWQLRATAAPLGATNTVEQLHLQLMAEIHRAMMVPARLLQPPLAAIKNPDKGKPLRVSYNSQPMA